MAADNKTRFDELDEEKARIEFEFQQAVKKGLDSDFWPEYSRARKELKKTSPKTKGVFLDPYVSQNGMGFYQKFNNFYGYDFIEQLALTPVISAIVSTRIEQISRFTQPQTDKYSMGFTFSKTDGSEMTDADKAEIRALTKFIVNCGDEDSNWHGDNFDMFTRKVMYGSLVFDQGNFQVVRNTAGEPIEFMAMDPKTIRIANTINDDWHSSMGDINTEGAKRAPQSDSRVQYMPNCVQIYQGRIIAEFYPWDLAFIVRNPSADIKSMNYGRSEVETLYPVIAAYVQAQDYNTSNFNLGSTPSGLLIVKNGGDFNSGEFMQELRQSMQGSKNSNRIGILEAEDFSEFVNFNKPNRDMEYTEFVNFLVRIMCASYKISPEEIGLDVDTAAKLADKSNKEEIQSSKDKGLVPLLKTYESYINKYIVRPKSKNKWELTFVGIDVDSAQIELDKSEKMGQTFLTFNEVREQNGYPSLGSAGDVINSAVYMQNLSAMKEAQAQENVQAQTTNAPEQDQESDLESILQELGL